MHSREINKYGGVVNILPKFSLIFIIFTLAALGLPGTSGFVGEFLVLVGAFKVNYLAAVIATIGVVLAAAYMLWLAKRIIFGKISNDGIKKLKDINFSERYYVCIINPYSYNFWVYPEPLIKTMNVSVNDLLNYYQIEINNQISMKIND